ncbi:Hypothetical_protein [Hexamita inflata]|uniref:Hypothetical_protein n=1 Tax=Hexamita inflata TaxID=28002 RepID=A0AA86V554_9EUKA|nr:Hypothetical protein HINF_LOCUS64322 [Hexamita inflata]
MTEFWKNNVNREEALLKLHKHIQTITQKEKFNPHEETVEIRGHTVIIEKVPFTNYGHSTQHYVLADIEYKLLKQCYQLYIRYFGKYLCYFIRWNVMLSELSIFLIFLNLKVPNTFYIATISKQQFKIFFKQLYF